MPNGLSAHLAKWHPAGEVITERRSGMSVGKWIMLVGLVLWLVGVLFKLLG